ncbi:MAG TPA: hypothetical protein QF353_04580 [Gammaproteobacteria bacterium]|nr:hypothetical protein [Gammaproteobacteria bacterium]
MKTDDRKRYDNALELFEQHQYEDAYKVFSSLAKTSSDDDTDLIILSKMYQGYMMALGRGVAEDAKQAHQIYINIANYSLWGKNFLCYKIFIAKINISIGQKFLQQKESQHNYFDEDNISYKASIHMQMYHNRALVHLREALLSMNEDDIVNHYNKLWSEATCLKARMYSDRLGYDDYVIDYEIDRWDVIFHYSDYPEFRSEAILALFRVGLDMLCKGEIINQNINQLILPLFTNNDECSPCEKFFNNIDSKKFAKEIKTFEFYRSTMIDLLKANYNLRFFDKPKQTQTTLTYSVKNKNTRLGSKQ